MCDRETGDGRQDSAGRRERRQARRWLVEDGKERQRDGGRKYLPDSMPGEEKTRHLRGDRRMISPEGTDLVSRVAEGSRSS